MTWMIIFGLIFIGLLLVFVEVIFIPGTTVVGIIGGVLMIIGIYFVYKEYGNEIGNYTLGFSVLANVILLIVGFKFITSNKATLNASIDSKVNILDLEKIKIGDNGTTFTVLRPNGKAIINGERVEVYSVGEYIDKDTSVEVSKIADNKIFVKPKNK